MTGSQEFLTKFTRKESFWFGEDEHKFDSFIDNGTTTVDKVYAWHQAKMKEARKEMIVDLTKAFAFGSVSQLTDDEEIQNKIYKSYKKILSKYQYQEE